MRFSKFGSHLVVKPSLNDEAVIVIMTPFCLSCLVSLRNIKACDHSILPQKPQVPRHLEGVCTLFLTFGRMDSESHSAPVARHELKTCMSLPPDLSHVRTAYHQPWHFTGLGAASATP